MNTNTDIRKPKLIVFGVGGAGGNAVNNMISSGLKGVEFYVANTDSQALETSGCTNRIQIGAELTQGLGAGSDPSVGRDSALEQRSEIEAALKDANMVFVAAGMGGGTGTGAAPVIAQIAKDLGILTVGVVTRPFSFEGSKRKHLADEGMVEMENHVDTLIVIPNQNLFNVASADTTFQKAFQMADEVLHSGVRSITDLMVLSGLINLDFADVRTIMANMGRAMMGTGEGTGENRAREAASAAINNPLLETLAISGAKGVLINVTGGPDMTLAEVQTAAETIRDEVGDEAHIIFGSAVNENLQDVIRVSIVATGLSCDENNLIFNRKQVSNHSQVKADPALSADPSSEAQKAPLDKPRKSLFPSLFGRKKKAKQPQLAERREPVANFQKPEGARITSPADVSSPPSFMQPAKLHNS